MQLCSDGRYYRVPEEMIGDKSMLVSYSKRKSDNFYRVHENLANEIALGYAAKEPVEFVKGRARARAGEYRIEESFRSKLRDYQILDIERMVLQVNSLNMNPMGLGKTVEAVGVLRAINASSVLVVAPKSTLTQWKRAIGKWWPEALSRVDILPKVIKRDRIVILNYERVAKIAEQLKSIQWDVHICDEAHRIKNPSSKRSIAVKSIPSNRRLALTGTPITNRPNDLWSILNWLDPRYVPTSYWDFVYYFCKLRRTAWGESIEGLTTSQARVSVLRKLLSRVSVRNELSVSEGKTVSIVRLEMESRQRELYLKTRDLAIAELPEKLTIANGAVLAMRLIQLTSFPGLFDTEYRQYGVGIKFEWIAELLEDNPEEKVVVYTRFSTVAEELCKYLKVPSVCYTGSMSYENRELAKQSFIERPEIRVLVGTIGSLGEGVDGLQYASRTAVFIDREWLPSVMEQCEERLNRMGQKYPVNCYYLECEKSFDQHVGKINLAKSEDIRAALASGEDV